MGLSATRIRSRIEAEVALGERLPGDRLPSVRDFAAELQVSPNTVAAAYKQLRERGVVLGRGRQGTVIAPSTRPTFTQLTAVPPGAIDALRGTPDQAFLPNLAPAFAAASQGQPVQYGDPLLDDAFANAASTLFEADGIDATNLAATYGAMDAVEKVLAANELRRGDRVGVEDPGHVPVHQLVRAAGLEVVPLALDDRGIRPEALEAALDQGLDALVLTPRAQNPTGAAFDAHRAEVLSKLLAGHHEILLIEDDHAAAISGVDWHPITPPGSRHAVIRSLGKTLGPDLRVSIVVGDPATIDRVSIAVSNGPGWVSHLLQRAAAHLLTDPSTNALISQAAQSYTGRREHLIRSLQRHGISACGTSGLHVWIPTADEQAMVEAARVAGFAIRAADSYRIDSPPAVRVTVSNLDHDQIDELADAMAKAVSTRLHSSTM